MGKISVSGKYPAAALTSVSYRRQVNVRIAALAVNGNSTGYIGNFTEEINLLPPNIGISCMGAVMPKRLPLLQKGTFFIAISLGVNYESMST
jgi:hypothetical protein